MTIEQAQEQLETQRTKTPERLMVAQLDLLIAQNGEILRRLGTDGPRPQKRRNGK